MEKKLGIIVPYRDRAQHRVMFLDHMSAMFRWSEILIVEQAPGKPFNRGKLLNIGVKTLADCDYYALHDVDMLPVQSDYTYPEFPTLLATKAQQFGYKMPFPEYFGGVVLISREHMLQANGFHNEFWSWGAEDNDFRDRVLATVGRIDHRDCTYKSLPHPRKMDNKLYPQNVALWEAGIDLSNGISNCEYTVDIRLVTGASQYIKVSI